MELYLWVLIAFGAVALLAAILYVPKFIQMSYCFKKPEHKVALEKRKLSLVIPARDESDIIGYLFDSLRMQDYDPAYYDVNVIVKDEDDPTVKMAKAIGANVIVIPEQKCKSDALDGYFKTLSDEQRDGYAAFAIIDADDVLAPDFVSELNNALEYDCQLYNTRKNIKNFLGTRKMRSVISNCSALTYPLLDEMGNYYRMRHNIPINFCGQGMLIRSDVIKKVGGWPFRTLTEDYELKMVSVLNGFTSMYYPYAVIYSEEVIRHRNAWSRRLRWLMGYSQCDRKYKKDIRKKFKQEKAGFMIRYEFFFSLIPLILFIVADLLTAIAGVAFAVYYGITGNPLWLNSLLLLTVFPLVLMYLLDFLYKILVMLSYRDAFESIPLGEKILTLLYCPIFDFEYFPLYIHAHLSLLFKMHLDWRHTERIHFVHRDKFAPKKRRKQRKQKKTKPEPVLQQEEIS